MTERKYYSIGDVARITGLPQHVLRFWGSKFKQIAPIRLAGGRRYYQKRDIEMIEHIKILKFEQNLTIDGIKQALKSRNDLTQPQAILAEARLLLQRLERIRAGFSPPPASSG